MPSNAALAVNEFGLPWYKPILKGRLSETVPKLELSFQILNAPNEAWIHAPENNAMKCSPIGQNRKKYFKLVIVFNIFHIIVTIINKRTVKDRFGSHCFIIIYNLI